MKFGSYSCLGTKFVQKYKRKVTKPEVLWLCLQFFNTSSWADRDASFSRIMENVCLKCFEKHIEHLCFQGKCRLRVYETYLSFQIALQFSGDFNADSINNKLQDTFAKIKILFRCSNEL